MATGGKIETRNHIIGFKEEISKASNESQNAFFTWFNDAKDTDMSFIRGCWDFDIHIALPLAKYINEPEEKTVLEIGHGGGRILAAVARHFKKVIGIDIHNCNELVEMELKNRGVNNIECAS